MSTNELLYNVGLGLLALAVVGGVLAVWFFFRADKQLHKQLETEYGKPRHS